MSSASLSLAGEGYWRLDGVLDHTSVPRLAKEGRALLRAHPRVLIDLQGVTSSNSLGLALLLEWQDAARARGHQVQYRHLPDALRRLAMLSNALPVLALVPEDSTCAQRL